MTGDVPWSEWVRLDQVGSGLARTLTADQHARGRVAAALDLAALDRLEAAVQLVPAGRGWRLTGTIGAEAVQTCGVTLEPLPATIDADFHVDLIDEADASPRAAEVELDALDGPDVVQDGRVDLASYVVEHLALALDPWPRKPGAVFEPPAVETEPSPFAVLQQLKPKT